MSIDDEGTECYIVMGFMNGSTVRDFSVSDETGLTFTNVGDWDVDRSRSYKEGKCGIVTKSDGYELCWGLGEEGNRVYTVSYTVTGGKPLVSVTLSKTSISMPTFSYSTVTATVTPPVR